MANTLTAAAADRNALLSSCALWRFYGFLYLGMNRKIMLQAFQGRMVSMFFTPPAACHSSCSRKGDVSLAMEHMHRRTDVCHKDRDRRPSSTNYTCLGCTISFAHCSGQLYLHAAQAYYEPPLKSQPAKEMPTWTTCCKITNAAKRAPPDL